MATEKINESVQTSVYRLLVSAYIKFARLAKEKPKAEKYLKDNGYNILTVCPGCGVDDFTHTDSCYLAKKHKL